MKTATIERYHQWGTRHHRIRVTYRGHALQWTEQTATGPAFVYADAVDYGHETLRHMRRVAARHGFTHVRFMGDWVDFTRPCRGPRKLAQGAPA